MRLNVPFLKLPIKVDADALAREVAALSSSAWIPHPSGNRGNEAVRLITPHGQASDATATGRLLLKAWFDETLEWALDIRWVGAAANDARETHVRLSG